MRSRHAPPSQLAEAVGEEAQRPLRGDARIELAHGAGGGVARIDELLLARRRAGARSALEVRAIHQDLAAHFEHVGSVALQAQRDRA